MRTFHSSRDLRPTTVRGLIAAASALGIVLLVLVIPQLVLPGIAADSLRDRLSKSGKVLDVEVSAFPAIELLWHQADKVVVRMASYHSSVGHLSSLLDEAKDAGTIDASARELNAGFITLQNATLRKRGNVLTGNATVSADALRSAIPGVQGLTPVASSDGQLTFQGTVFGITADATLSAQNGRLVVQPDIPLLSVLTLTAFDDPHVYVEGVAASDAPGGFALSARARLQ
jgi:hypothetical protein